MNTDALMIRNISYQYPNSREMALYSLDIELPNGCAMALLGPNGAGKSTLMDILLQWKQPDKGEIFLFGKPLHAYSRRQMGQTVALVPQDENASFAFSVLDYVLFGRTPYLGDMSQPTANDFEAACEALETVGLQGFATREVTSLSGGERQLLLLARAVAQQPRLLLLDEPTSALDPANTAKVLEILHHLHESGITLFFTTHDPSMAAELATHVAMLKNGKLLASGPMAATMTPQALSNLYGTPMDTLVLQDKMLVFRA